MRQEEIVYWPVGGGPSGTSQWLGRSGERWWRITKIGPGDHYAADLHSREENDGFGLCDFTCDGFEEIKKVVLEFEHFLNRMKLEYRADFRG